MRLPRPVAIDLAEGDSALWVGCENGQLSRFRTEPFEWEGSWQGFPGLSDLQFHAGRRQLFCTVRDALVEYVEQDGELLFRSEQILPAGPHQLLLDGMDGFITSQWARTLRRFSVEPSTRAGLSQAGELLLPFEPGCLALSPDGRTLVVADAFGGLLAVVERDSFTLEGVHSLAAANLTDLAFSEDGRRLWLAHQVLNPLARSTQEDIHWGQFVSGALRSIPQAALHEFPTPATLHGRLHTLGDVGAGAADPSALVPLGTDRFLVLLAGNNELARWEEGDLVARQRLVGRPTAMVVSSDQRWCFAVEPLVGQVARIDLRDGQTQEVELPVPEGAPDRDELVAAGERLFFSAELSHDGWMSCHSCHSNGHSTAQLCDTLGDNTYATPKRIPSLLGVGVSAPYGWNGEKATLEQQIEQSLQSTLHSGEIPRNAVLALAAFLRTLPPPPRSLSARRSALQHGRELFEKRDCVSCHTPPVFTSSQTASVGLRDEKGLDRFNPPSLRGQERRRSLLHHGHAATIVEVLESGHPGGESYSTAEIEALVGYLRSL